MSIHWKKCRCSSLQKEKTQKLENTVYKLPVLQNLPFQKWDNNTEIQATEHVQL